MKKQSCAGKIYLRNGEEHRGTVKIMAIADGWVMARHKGRAPFLKTEKEFFAQYTEVPND